MQNLLMRLCSLAVAILIHSPQHAQNRLTSNALEAYTEHFASFSKQYPQEKAYLHFDNTAYYQGETI